MFLESANQSSVEVIFTIVSATVAVVSLLVSIVLFFLSRRSYHEERLTNKFGDAYRKSFAIREEIGKSNSRLLNNQNFYFEFDYIFNNEAIQSRILDYITDIENYFSIVVDPFKLDKSFKNLSSFALYSRWCSLYGYVIKMRKRYKSSEMFKNFIKVVNKMEKMEKVKNRIAIPKNICYVGIRQTDCLSPIRKEVNRKNLFDKTIFARSITMFPDDKTAFAIRPNQNINGIKFLPYVEKKINEAIQDKENKVLPKFMFYNQSMAYKLSDELRKYFICLNDIVLLNKINDKITCKIWLQNNNVKIVSFQTMLGDEIQKLDFDSIGKSKKYVIQNNHGAGGIGTYLLTKENFDRIKSLLIPNGQYIVSPYLENCISVNTHVFISDKQTVLSPASIQIIEKHDNQLYYRGADFIAFRNIDRGTKNKIRDESLKIANLLRNNGYKGVAGIDFMIDSDKNVFCSEINPRFQSSSVLLDLYLAKHKTEGLASSIYELNLQAFNNALKTDLSFDDSIDYSCYYYYKENIPTNYFFEKKNLLKKEAIRVDEDGLDFQKKNNINADSYMFRAIFSEQITDISPDNNLWINDNIAITDKPQDLLHLKVALLNQGVRIKKSNKANSDIKKAVYDSVDISFRGLNYGNFDIDINCAYNINLSKYSPYVLNLDDHNLYYYNEVLGTFKQEVDLPKSLSDKSKKILYMSTDRIRIKMISGCEFKNAGIGCEFCDVPYSKERFEFKDIKDALEQLKKSKITFRHFLIGGGTCLSKTIWDDIINLVKYLKADDYFKDKPISLMSILPPAGEDSNSVLRRLKDAGIDEVAFNLEIANDTLAKQLMPGKYKGKDTFYQTMKSAIKIFGIGKVRSALVVGLDKKDDIINEVKKMTYFGIMPCLSALRALPNARAHLKIHPSNDYLIDIYLSCKDVINTSNCKIKRLGPPCKRCQNNMLVLE